jgi:hypothetical protein
MAVLFFLAFCAYLGFLLVLNETAKALREVAKAIRQHGERK